METRSGVAHSTQQDSFLAGQELAKKALQNAGIKECNFALVFASVEHHVERLLEGIYSILGPGTHIMGATSPGILTNDFLSYEGMIAGILVIASESITFKSCRTGNLNEGEEIVGKRLGQKLKELISGSDSNLLLFYDGVNKEKTSGLEFHLASPLLSGIEREIGKWPPVAGVGIVDIVRPLDIRLWDKNAIVESEVMALVLKGSVRMDTAIMHGCKPASDYHRITRLEGNKLLEVNGRPALELVRDYLGDPSEVDWTSITTLITLGVNRGDKYGPFREENYVNRMVFGIDEKSGGLFLGETDLKEGDEFQFMRRSIETDMVGDEARKLLASLNGRKPLFALYISCLGRIKKLYGSENEEGDEVREALGDIPLLGIYSGVEIASVLGKVMPLDWTGVLCVFSEAKEKIGA